MVPPLEELELLEEQSPPHEPLPLDEPTPSCQLAPRAHPAVALYQQRCWLLRRRPDPVVSACLQSEFDTLTMATEQAGPGCLAPLLGVFSLAPAVRTLRLAPDQHTLGRRLAGGAGDVDAWTLRAILREQQSLTALELPWCGLTLRGLSELVPGLAGSSVRRCDLAGNSFGNKGCAVLADGLGGGGLAQLDLSYNWLHHDQVLKVTRALGHGCCLRNEGNNYAEEIASSITHGLGVVLTLCGAPALLSRCDGPIQFWSCLLYVTALLGLYVASTLFHAMFMTERPRWIFGVLDHSAIYLLIAGSYTPFCLITLQFPLRGGSLAVLEWSLAGLGIAWAYLGMHLEWIKARPGLNLCVELALYLIMGWAAVCVWGDLERELGPDGHQLLVHGGYAYTFGVVFFLAENWHPSSHVVWHVFVMIGSIMHFFCILLHCVGPHATCATQLKS